MDHRLQIARAARLGGGSLELVDVALRTRSGRAGVSTSATLPVNGAPIMVHVRLTPIFRVGPVERSSAVTKSHQSGLIMTHQGIISTVVVELQLRKACQCE